MSKIYDVIVIGRGLFGCPAAKYLQMDGLETLLIGPKEPAASEYDRARVFSSHYDSGRVTRKIGKTKDWSRLNAQTQAAFKTIEAQSGMHFFGNEGCLYISDLLPDDHFDKAVRHQLLSKEESDFAIIEEEQLPELFPFFRFRKPSVAYLEKALSGHLNPRRLIEAQLKIFTESGGETVDEVVESVIDKGDIYEVSTANGQRFKAKKILYATGVFHPFFGFNTPTIPLEIKTETIALAEVSKEQAAGLQSMPSLLYTCKTETYDEIYAIRPVLYPTGRYFLKLGANLTDDRFLTRIEDIKKWFCSPPLPQQEEVLKKMTVELFPTIPFLSFQVKHCIIEYTQSRRPLIDKVGREQYICTGGNGYGAMCSDAMGRLGALCVQGKDFQEGFSAGFFAL
ncbi:NAD(P)/FAD-dependent oxidoreductase [Runella slithyformis]|uniref:FAD dependent oxidoreductase n=1 Tax=Runella slithyformis (strain ATCC 29530 / DSM 19594 / LMG 11500 / NCIMB 11436 / LSU 4) TaxID=761193 RepID=A0A7U3ZRY5_RUNSL|nr:FAD-binding oxidoreductase [Runella slithyformis]AEI52238.1 FAD dependent oxidoreductase [Runella slithyformis DSM 19594]